MLEILEALLQMEDTHPHLQHLGCSALDCASRLLAVFFSFSSPSNGQQEKEERWKALESVFFSLSESALSALRNVEGVDRDSIMSKIRSLEDGPFG